MSLARSGALRASASRCGDVLTVALAGELDLATGPELRARLTRLVQSDPPPARLVLDLAHLQFLDASGISALLSAQRAVAASGGSVVLRSPSRLVRRVVKVLDLDRVLPVEV